MKKLQVINSNGEKEPYKPRKISKQIIEETQCSEELAQKIQNRVSTKLYKLGLDEINTRQIRAEVSSQLLKEGMVSDAKTEYIRESASDEEGIISIPEIAGDVKAEFDRIFDRYGLWYDLGFSWSLTCYKK